MLRIQNILFDNRCPFCLLIIKQQIEDNTRAYNFPYNIYSVLARDTMVNTGMCKSTKSVRADIGQGLIQDVILDKEYVYILIFITP